MNLSNNFIHIRNNNIEKKFLDKKRFKRELYFYKKFKNHNINIPKILSYKKNAIVYKKYQFKKIKNQQLFFDELLKFLIKTNKIKNYKIYAKERLILITL